MLKIRQLQIQGDLILKIYNNAGIIQEEKNYLFTMSLPVCE